MAHKDDNDIPDFEEYPNYQNEKGGTEQKYDNYNVSQFKDFGLKDELLRAVKESGFEHPTRVQMETLTNALQGE